MRMQAFGPTGNSVSLTVTASSGNVQVTNSGGVGQPSQVRVFNNGTNVVYLAFGQDNTVTASTANSFAMVPNSVEVFTVPTFTTNALYVAAIAGTTGNTLNITPGEGI